MRSRNQLVLPLNLEIKIDKNDPVRKLAEIFAMEGKQLYIVGGAARDMVLGRIPHDYDLATNCTPAETMAIIENNGFAVLPIAGAIEHGVVFSMVENEQFEIASFRGDGNYTDGRHCDVTFGVSLEEDLKRRDFTMNAMAINPPVSYTHLTLPTKA